MPKFEVETISVQRHHATVDATDSEQARRIVLANLDMTEPGDNDPELDDVGDWAWPTPMDDICSWVEDVRQIEAGGGR